MNEHDRKLLNSYFFVNGVIAVIIVIGAAMAMLIITAYTLWNMT
jgi:hypothetical protein